jgi:hypothetical protein
MPHPPFITEVEVMGFIGSPHPPFIICLRLTRFVPFLLLFRCFVLTLFDFVKGFKKENKFFNDFIINDVILLFYKFLISEELGKLLIFDPSILSTCVSVISSKFFFSVFSFIAESFIEDILFNFSMLTFLTTSLLTF